MARRALEGDSWLVRISLAQTGRWLVVRGQVPGAELKDVPKEFTPRGAGALVDDERYVGRSAAPSRADAALLRDAGALVRPSVPLGYNAPAWPARVA